MRYIWKRIEYRERIYLSGISVRGIISVTTVIEKVFHLRSITVPSRHFMHSDINKTLAVSILAERRERTRRVTATQKL